MLSIEDGIFNERKTDVTNSMRTGLYRLDVWRVDVQ